MIELGEEDVFPHVGRYTMIELDGREVYPVVTGTFGGVDFLHSVTGEGSWRTHSVLHLLSTANARNSVG